MRTENIMQSNKKIASSCPRLGYPKRALIRGSAFWRLRAHLAFESCFDNTESSVFHIKGTGLNRFAVRIRSTFSS
jgi:hypothetical protein